MGSADAAEETCLPTVPPPLRRRRLAQTLLVALLWLLWLRGPVAGGPAQVVIYGGTPQGITAAVAAARSGARTLLIEPGPQLGGVLTRAWLATLDDTDAQPGVSIYPGQYRAFLHAMGDNRSIDLPAAERYFWRQLRQAGVQVWLNSPLLATERAGTRIARLQVRRGWWGQQAWLAGGGLGRWSRPWLTPGVVIDASDTAALAHAAGVPFTTGRQDSGLDRAQMAAGLIFRLDRVPWWPLARAVAAETGRGQLAGFDSRGAYGFGALSDRYRPSTPQLKLRGLNIARQRDGTLLINALLVLGVDGTDPAALRQAHARAEREAGRVVAFLRQQSPAVFGRARLAGVAPELYLRETRHLSGPARLEADQLLRGGVAGWSVVQGGYPLDGQVYRAHESPYLLGRPRPYGVGLAQLRPPGTSNLLVVSQAAAFSSAAAYSARVVPLQMALGEVAGEAAGLALARGWSLAALMGPRQPALHARLETLGFRPRWQADCLPGAEHPALVNLYRRGLFGAPYSFARVPAAPLAGQGPVRATDFVATLEHWLAAHGKWAARREALLALRQWGDRDPEAQLSWAGARAIFLWLREDAWEVTRSPRLLTQADAAHLLLGMFPAAERQAGTPAPPLPRCRSRVVSASTQRALPGVHE